MAARCLALGHKELNIVSQSSPTGTQLLAGGGLAEAGYGLKLIKEIEEALKDFTPMKSFTSPRDGRQQGEFWERLTQPAIETAGCFPARRQR